MSGASSWAGTSTPSPSRGENPQTEQLCPAAGTEGAGRGWGVSASSVGWPGLGRPRVASWALSAPWGSCPGHSGSRLRAAGFWFGEQSRRLGGRREGGQENSSGDTSLPWDKEEVAGQGRHPGCQKETHARCRAKPASHWATQGPPRCGLRGSLQLHLCPGGVGAAPPPSGASPGIPATLSRTPGPRLARPLMPVKWSRQAGPCWGGGEAWGWLRVVGRPRLAWPK